MRFLLAVAAALGAASVEAGVASARLHDPAVRNADSRPPKWRISPSHVVHERHEPEHTDGWTRVERAEPTATLPMRIGLRQSNLDLGHELLMNISHPASPHYGKHMTSAEVIALFAPANESVDAVRNWLIHEGVPRERISLSANKQWIQFDAAVADAERLLHTAYHVYEHDDSGTRSIACTEYHVPRSVRAHIDYITPGIKLMSAGYGRRSTELARRRQEKKKQTKKARQTIESDIAHVQTDDADDIAMLRNPGPCSTTATPACVRAQYQIPSGTRAALPGNELGVFQSLSQHYNQLDLDTYFSNVTPWIPNGTSPSLRSINGADGPTTNQLAAGEEADLDFEVAIPLIHPQRTVLFQTDDEWYQLDQQKTTTRYTGFFNTFFDALDGSYCSSTAFGETGDCGRDACRDPEYPDPNADSGYQGERMCGVFRPTNVIAISYSGVEASLPYSYMQRQCLEVMKLALQGVTVVESSGDQGVGGMRNDPNAGCLGPNRDVYAPRTMSNCPYVLSVGATRGIRYREVAPTYFASGGGFSNVFPTPPWQRAHVESYLSRANLSHLGYVGGGTNFSHVGVEPGKLFNKAGRGYPDVAAIGDNYLVYLQGMSVHLRGTSIAAPIWASILTLINEERLARGKSTVGFVHQALYHHPEVFTDITKGSNPGCGSGGFQVHRGWDPVTGLGSPVYPKLLKLFLELP